MVAALFWLPKAPPLWDNIIIEKMAIIDIEHLTRDERLDLLERLWEVLSRDQVAVPITEHQREELDRRLDRLNQEGPTGIPWEQVRDEMVDR
jgi:putative addiction module component (TIGR02574 family)